MIPAHSSGAACSSGTASGSTYAYSSRTRQNSAYPPSTSQPVKVGCRQRFSAPRRQNRQEPSVPPSHGTPTRSPVRNRVAPGPSASTTPTTSWPGVTSGRVGGRSPSARCRSVRQTPQVRTLTRTWPAPGSGTSRSTSRSGPPSIGPGRATTHARTTGSLGRVSPSDLLTELGRIGSRVTDRDVLLADVLQPELPVGRPEVADRHRRLVAALPAPVLPATLRVFEHV